MSKSKRMSAVQKAALKIQAVTAMIIRDGLVRKYGDGYRPGDLVSKVKELTKDSSLNQQGWYAAMQVWIDKKIATFNNKLFTPVAKKYNELIKLAQLAPAT